jgi:uncharacterized protein YndB with AHSA1/START domain
MHEANQASWQISTDQPQPLVIGLFIRDVAGVPFHDEYHAIERPCRLVNTSVYEGAHDHEALDTMTFEQDAIGTLVRCVSRHSSLAARDFYVENGMQRGLTESHRRLDTLLTALQQPQRWESR